MAQVLQSQGMFYYATKIQYIWIVYSNSGYVHRHSRDNLLLQLGDLATVIETKENAVQTNQGSTLLLDGCPRTIAKIIATATRFLRFS